jgi:uncharacterized membrane protein YoaK (UPF0700 family)
MQIEDAQIDLADFAASPAQVACDRRKERGRHVMKRISLLGVVLGLIVGALAAMLSGSWILWLGAGMVVGVLLGAAQARRSLEEETRLRERVNL